MKGNKTQKVYRIIMLIVVVSIITFVITSILNYDNSRKYVITTSKDTTIVQKIETSISSIKKILDEKYLGELDEDELIDGALRGMVAAAGDVYTEYYSKKELEDFTASTLGNFVGIGIYMQADMESNRVTVISPISGSPAERAGIKTGDKIIKVDGVEYTAEQINEVTVHVRGEAGTEVELELERNGETFNVTVTRENVHINYISSEMLENNIGYIAISTFDVGCADDFLNAYNELSSKGAKSLIIDLRNNGGGLVDEALNIADLICNKGETLLITADKNDNKETRRAKTSPTITMPIILLTNEGSASASEILAAALKDNEKAEIVGEKTFGKGVIQELIYLSNGGALKVTCAEYYTPNGNKINKLGIEPDYKVADKDEQLKKAIEIVKNK